jgi:hypothetical protein
MHRTVRVDRHDLADVPQQQAGNAAVPAPHIE